MKTLPQTDKELFNWLFRLTAEHDCRWVAGFPSRWRSEIPTLPHNDGFRESL